MARLHVRVQPGARSTKWVGWLGDIPKLAVTAPPVGGAANVEAIRAVAQLCGVHERQVRIVGGAASRSKRFDVDGVALEEIERALIDTIGDGPKSNIAR